MVHTIYNINKYILYSSMKTMNKPICKMENDFID